MENDFRCKFIFLGDIKTRLGFREIEMAHGKSPVFKKEIRSIVLLNYWAIFIS